MTISFRDIKFLFWLPFIWTLYIRNTVHFIPLCCILCHLSFDVSALINSFNYLISVIMFPDFSVKTHL
jgi:hypothetical protein